MSKSCILAAFCALAIALPALGQNTGRLTGKVEDQSGAAVPGAEVTLTLPGSATAAYSAQTSVEGYFNLIGLRPARYEMSVKSSGFQNYVAREVKIDPGRELSLPAIKLEVGAVTETVDVIAQPASVQTSNAEISTTVTTQQIRNLPVLDRQVIALIQTQPGVSSGRGTTVINGLRTSAANVTVDGINVQDNYFRRNSLEFMPNRPSIDQVAEFTIITSNANSTVSGGVAQVIMVTPSGTNEYHGSLYWYNRNNFFSANTWFNNRDNVARPFLNQNQVGYTLGGHIIKNKLMFFTGYEILRLSQQTALNRRVLTPDARNGIFTYLDAAGATRRVNVLELANVQIDPYMKTVIDQIPTTINNFRTGDSSAAMLRTTAGYSFLARNNRTRDNFTGKLDYIISTKHTLTGTFLWNNEYVDRADAQNDTTANTNGFGVLPLVYTDASRKLVSVTYRWNPAPRFTNELRAGFNYAPSIFNTTEEGDPFRIATTLFSNPATNFLPQGRDTRTYHITDTANYIHGRHNIQFGFNGQQLRIRNYDDAGRTALYTMGIGAGNPGLTNAQLPGASAVDVTQANNLLANLAGYVTSFTQTFNVTSRTSGYVGGASNVRHLRWLNYAFFAQDNWKVKPRLTLNLGVRWEPFLPVDERDALALMPVIQNGNLLQTLRSDATLDFAGSRVGRPWYKSDYNNFAPNVGLAWDVFGDGRTSVRAGYVVSFINDNIIATLNNNVVNTNRGLNTQAVRTGLTSRISTNLPVPATPPFQVPTTFSTQYAIDRTVAFGIPDPNLATPYVQQWNFGIQREIKGNVLEIRYVGNKATKLYRGIDFNQVDINASGFLDDFRRAYSNGNLARAAGIGFDPAYRPEIPGSQPLTVFPQLPNGGNLTNATYRNLIATGEVGELAYQYQRDARNGNINFFKNPYALGTNVITNFSNSSYHSIQAEFNRRFSRGLLFQTSYVYGKVLSDANAETDEQFDAFLDINNPKLERARATHDLNHLLKANAQYTLPFGPGHKVDYRPLRHLIGGWTISGIFSRQSGSPFSILSTRATLNRSGARSNGNTAISNLTKSELDDLIGFRMTGDGPFYVASSAIHPQTGRAVSADGSPAFAGQAFFHPGPGQVGTLQRRMFSAPSVWNLDMSVVKRMTFFERHVVELRMDAANALNHPTFYIADQTLDSATFGRITQLFYDRRLVQFGLYYRF